MPRHYGLFLRGGYSLGRTVDIRARSLVSHPFVRVAFVSFFPDGIHF